MPTTQTACPRCRQPVRVEYEQLFDVGMDPSAKQKILSGQFNLINCSNCGFSGPLPTPIVYHDPEKEYLFTYFPPELGLPVNEQERLVGPLITRVTNNLPAEKRKAYLFRPQTMLTMETMVEKIYEGEGITKEMLQDRQKRLMLIQRMLSTTPDSLPDVVKQEDENIDEMFFALFSQIIEVTMAQGDQQAARALAAVQGEILKNSTFGARLEEQNREAEAAVKALEAAGKEGLTREKLLDLLIEADNEIRINTMVSLARAGVDYAFFEILAKRIEEAGSEEEKQKLTGLREHLLRLTSEIDKAMEEQVKATHAMLEEIVAAEDTEAAIRENAEGINDLFVQIVRSEYDKAREGNDLERMAKIRNVIETLQRLSAPPPEYALVEKLLGAEDDAARRKILEENAEAVTPQFLDLLNGLSAQSQEQGQPLEVVNGLLSIYNLALRFSMERKFKG